MTPVYCFHRDLHCYRPYYNLAILALRKYLGDDDELAGNLNKTRKLSNLASRLDS